MEKYDIVIGLEIHAELNTATKLFCSCKNDTAAEPNANVCPYCMSLPGAFPRPNRVAIEKAILAGMAFDCKINEQTFFERKHYFYPDLPAGYQITQLDQPQCLGGHIMLKSGKKIRLNRIHLEEDAGKLNHNEVLGETLVDLNRAGVPLLEMVTEPDISTAQEAVEFLEEVRSRFVFSGTANCRMEEGGMRCDVNISLKPKGRKEFGARVEMKNLNSFRSVARAIEYESTRHAKLLDDGKKIDMETRKWNDGKGISTSMRGKEGVLDYMHYNDHDQYPIRVTEDDIAQLRATLPKLAHEYRKEFTESLGLPEYDTEILTREKSICTFFLLSIDLIPEPKKIANWILTDVLARCTNYEIRITAEQFTKIIKMVDARKITKTNALELMDKIWDNPKADPEKIAKEMGIIGGVTEKDIASIVTELISANAQAVTDYTTTPDKVLNFFMGQLMKRTQGKADSVIAREIIIKLLVGKDNV